MMVGGGFIKFHGGGLSGEGQSLDLINAPKNSACKSARWRNVDMAFSNAVGSHRL